MLKDKNIKIKDKVFLSSSGSSGTLASFNPNLFAIEGVYLLEK